MGARRRGRPRVLFYYGDLGLRNSARAGGPRSLTMQHATRNTIIMVGTPNTLVRQTVLVAGVTLAMCAVFATGFAAGRSFVPAEDDVELGRRLSWFGVGSAVETNAIPIGIYPIMRDFSCGHLNMEPPRALQQPGRGRLVIDVGLSAKPLETITAMTNGFNVIGFELVPENFRKIRRTYKDHPRVRFVNLEPDGRGGWKLPASVVQPPPLGADGSGFAYIINAGLASKSSTAYVDANGTPSSQVGGAGGKGAVATPLATLDDVLPPWAGDAIYMLKVDTQGFELNVLAGARKSLAAHRFKYVLYEFSPSLMTRGLLGSPMDLLREMPRHGAICFDMMGEQDSHNALTPKRTSRPLSAYLAVLTKGDNDGCASHHEKELCGASARDFGMWDDILCFDPMAREWSETA